MLRVDGRKADQLRPVKITRHYNKHAEGSALIEIGDTRVLCTATIEDRVANFLKGTGQGWVTAEYGMLPRATGMRTMRESLKGFPGGRTLEIQRLIGRSLRAVVDLEKLGERTIVLDCDVLQADGGTRSAAITGGYIALVDALQVLVVEGIFPKLPIKDFVAAVSAGVFEGSPLLDLSFVEDSGAIVDFNVVMTGEGCFVEVQGTGEQYAFQRAEMENILNLAELGIQELIATQKSTLGSLGESIGAVK